MKRYAGLVFTIVVAFAIGGYLLLRQKGVPVEQKTDPVTQAKPVEDTQKKIEPIQPKATTPTKKQEHSEQCDDGNPRLVEKPGFIDMFEVDPVTQQRIPPKGNPDGTFKPAEPRNGPPLKMPPAKDDIDSDDGIDRSDDDLNKIEPRQSGWDLKPQHCLIDGGDRYVWQFVPGGGIKRVGPLNVSSVLHDDFVHVGIDSRPTETTISIVGMQKIAVTDKKKTRMVDTDGRWQLILGEKLDDLKIQFGTNGDATCSVEIVQEGDTVRVQINLPKGRPQRIERRYP